MVSLDTHWDAQKIDRYTMDPELRARATGRIPSTATSRTSIRVTSWRSANGLDIPGIIFLDEIDKIAGRESGHGPDVSREGVQRDILPIVERTTINSRYGMVRTDHILFIAAGAFHVSKPSDLIPELQGCFPFASNWNH